jgi:hypothetical protein
MADEKRAFEAMMAEVGDSDSDEDLRKPAKKASSNRGFDAPKSTNSTRNMDQQGTNQDQRPAPPKENTRAAPPAAALSKTDQDIMNFGMESKKGGGGGGEKGRGSTTAPISKNWYMRPCPPSEPTMLCYVERERPTFGALSGGTIYRMYLEVGNDPRRAKFLMSAKKILSKRTSYYLITTEMEPNDDRGGDEVLGKVRANAVGSRYLLTDHGLAPDKSQAPSMHRKASASSLEVPLHSSSLCRN